MYKIYTVRPLFNFVVKRGCSIFDFVIIYYKENLICFCIYSTVLFLKCFKMLDQYNIHALMTFSFQRTFYSQTEEKCSQKANCCLATSNQYHFTSNSTARCHQPRRISRKVAWIFVLFERQLHFAGFLCDKERAPLVMKILVK